MGRLGVSLSGRTLAVVLTVALLPVVALTLFTPFYQTNDDVAMRLLAEGNFVPGDEPLPYLIFINVIVGQLLALAYQWTAAVPWYDLALGGSMIVASAALLHVWVGAARPLEILWTIVLAAFFLLPTLVSVQFSLVGLTCAAAGVGLITRAGVADLERRSRRLHLQLGTALFVWGSLIRFEGAILIALEGAVLALPFVVEVRRRADRRPIVRGTVLALCAATLLAGAGFVVNQAVYRQAKGWNDFYEYNFLRARVGEYIPAGPITAETGKKLTTDVGWSANDLALFRDWFFTDPQLFSLATVRRADHLFYGASGEPATDWRAVRLQQALGVGQHFFAEARWAFLLMGVFVAACGLRPRLALYLGGVALTLAVFVVGIGLALKAPPQRISSPMLIMAATLLTLAAQRWGRRTHWSLNLTAAVAAIYILAATLLPLKGESERHRLEPARVQTEIEVVRRTGPTLFILHGSSFPYEDFWTPLRVQRGPFEFINLGATQRTPPVQKFLAETGRLDLPWSLCIDPEMVIVADDPVPKQLATFVEEHRGVRVQFEPVFRGAFIHAWRCRRT